MKRHEAIHRLRLVEDEFAAARLGVEELVRVANRDPGVLSAPAITMRDVRRARSNMEATYLVRMFAEFEGFLRSYWAELKESEPAMKDLIDGVVARRRSVPVRVHEQVHAVREYRNAVIHHGETTPVEMFGECRSCLCRFLSHLPEEW